MKKHRDKLNKLQQDQETLEQTLKKTEEARKTIQESINEHEKKFDDYMDANNSLKAKNEKLLAESAVMERELMKHGLLTEA